MLVRIVRMTFRKDSLSEFREIFDRSKDLISEFPGCTHLELWQDAGQENVMTTYSIWESQEALDAYRESLLFRNTWEKAKRLFDQPAIAASYRTE